MVDGVNEFFLEHFDACCGYTGVVLLFQLLEAFGGIFVELFLSLRLIAPASRCLHACGFFIFLLFFQFRFRSRREHAAGDIDDEDDVLCLGFYLKKLSRRFVSLVLRDLLSGFAFLTLERK